MESLVKEGVLKKRPKAFFVCFVKRKKIFFIQKKKGPLCCSFWRTLWKSMEVKLAVFVLPSTCSSLVLFPDFFEVMFYRRHHSLSRFLTRSSLLAAPEGMYGRAGKGRLTCRKKGRKRDTQGEWSMQKKKKERYNLPSGKAYGPCQWFTTEKSATAFTHTIKAEDRNCFLCHFFIQLVHFLCFIRDVILKKAKTSSSNLGLYCIQHYLNSFSLSLHMTTLQPKTLSYSLCFWFLLRCHVYCCWCSYFSPFF